MPCEDYSIRKVRQVVINKHVDDSMKYTWAKRIFSDLVTAKAPQDSGITITNKTWHIVVDQYTWQRSQSFTVPRVTSWNRRSKQLASGKITGNQYHTLSMTMHHRTMFWQNLQWKLSIITEYTGKGMPKRNQLVKLGFADVKGKARAVMVQANLPEEIKYKPCK